MEGHSTSALPATTSTAAAFGKKWRDKLRNNREKKAAAKLSVDEAVNDFLGVHRKNQASNGNDTDFVSAQPAEPLVPPPAPKQPRRLGLKVSFDLAPPDVIGEGGEEADLPTKHIALSRPSQQRSPDSADLVDGQPGLEDEGLPAIAISTPGNDELGFSSDWRPPLTTDTTLLRALSSAGTGGKYGSRLSMRVDDETAELARKIRAKMMEEEGRALHRKMLEDEEDAKELDQETRRSIELISAQHQTNIVSPQPQRVVAYRPRDDESFLNAFNDDSRIERQDSKRVKPPEPARMQDMISHLRNDGETQSEGHNSSQDDLHGLGVRPAPSQPYNPNSRPQPPALNPFDLSSGGNPRNREHDYPVSPINNVGNGIPSPQAPTSNGVLNASPISNGSPRPPPQQYESYQRTSPSLGQNDEQLVLKKQRSAKWSSNLSRANTTARSRVQPSVSESLMSRSFSMRNASPSHRDPNQRPPPSVGWHKFQYQPVPSLPSNHPDRRPPAGASSKPSPRQIEPPAPPPQRSPVSPSRPAAASSNTPPAPYQQHDIPLPPDPFRDSASRSSTDQSSHGQSSSNSLESPASSSATTMPVAESATTAIAGSSLPPSPTEQVALPKESANAKKSWRTLTTAVTRDALVDLSAAAERYYPLFALGANDALGAAGVLKEKDLGDWVRASVWWVLKGRNQLEASIRQGGNEPGLHHQGAISLAKAWWINAEVIPKHTEIQRLKHQIATSNGSTDGSAKDIGTDVVLNLARSLGDARLNSLIASHQGVASHVRALATSMKRNNIHLPPPDQLLNNVDLSIWVKYPYFGADVTMLLSTLVPKTLRVDPRSKASDIDIGELMPFSDTTRFFTYGRMFVTAILRSIDGDEDQRRKEEEQAMPCVVALAREKQDWHIQAFIASQSGLVNVVIQADKRQGPTWHDVRFDRRKQGAMIRLSRSWKLELRFNGPDGKTEFERLLKMVEHSRTIEAGLDCEENEEIVFEGVLKAFQYVGTPGAAGAPFPAEPTPRCRVRLFEKQVPMAENGGTRFAHMGFRLICVTSPKVKNLSSLTHTFTHTQPVVFAHARSMDDEENSPILLLRITNRQTGAPYQIRLTFHDNAEMLKLHTMLLNVNLAESEEKTSDINLRSYSIEDPTISTRSNLTPISLLAFPGQATGTAAKPGVTVSVINTAREFLDHGQSPVIMSNSLRLFIKCGWGSVTDRMNLGPGEMKIALDPSSLTVLSIYRRGQHDLLVSMADNLAPQDARETVTKFLKAAGSTPTIRKFQFSTVRDVHKFQKALTGFDVLFDGFATSFAISRRRMVVPIYKKWEASGARIQLLQQEKSIQLVAFFADFSHGKGMNFVVKGTDVFEIFSKGGRYGVRIVDAKFPLPKKPGQAVGDGPNLNPGEEEFLSLDLPEFPSEHDDITILFEDEHAWKDFQTAVPGIIREQSRIGSLRH